MWIFRGQDIPPIMKEECFDLDLYNWHKVDPSDAVRMALQPACVNLNTEPEQGGAVPCKPA